MGKLIGFGDYPGYGQLEIPPIAVPAVASLTPVTQADLQSALAEQEKRHRTGLILVGAGSAIAAIAISYFLLQR